MDETRAGATLARYEKAKTRRERWLEDWEDCYDLAFPGRDSFYQETPGESRTVDLYDDTAVGAVQDFSSLITDGLFGGKFVRLKPGYAVPRDQRRNIQEALDEISDTIFDIVRNCNFDEGSDEVAQDLSIGTGSMIIRASQGAEIVSAQAVPLHEVTLDRGPFGEIDGVFRCRMIKHAHIASLWPKAKIPDTLEVPPEREHQSDLKVLEACFRDFSTTEEVYRYEVIAVAAKETLYEEEYRGMGSKPWINPRWSKASGEIYGRGPLLNVLNSVRGLNLLKRLIFENADIEIGGVWTVENDGMINVDTILIESGVIVPHGAGSKGLQRIQSSSNFDVSQFIMNDEKLAIRRALFVEDFAGRGDTPISAEEVAARRMMLAKRAGGPANRLFKEWVVPVIRRIIYLARRQGLIDLPRVDGREIAVVATSPLARAAAFEQVQRKMMAIGMTGQLFGEMAPNSLDMRRIAADVLELMEQPAGYLMDAEGENQMLPQMQAADVAGQIVAPGQAA